MAAVLLLLLLGLIAKMAFERKKTLVKLRNHEARYQSIFSSQTIGILVASLEGPVLEVNDAYLKMIGYTRAQFEREGLRWDQITPPEYREQDLQKVAEIYKNGFAREYEKQYVHQDGHRVDVWLSGIARIAGSADQVVSYVQDITERKRMERSLRDSEARFRTLADSVPVLIWLTDANGQVVYANQVYAQSVAESGWSAEGLALEEDRWLDWVHPHDQAQVSLLMEDAAQRCEGYQYQCRIQCHKGSYRWMQVTGLPRLTTEGAWLGYVSSAVDITEQKEMHQLLDEAIQERTRQLQKSNALLSSIVENVPAMIFFKEAEELRFELFNKAGKALVGFDEDDLLLGKNDYDFFPEAQARFFIEKDRETLRGKSLVDIPEEPLQTRQGELRYLHTKKVPILDDQGEAAYLLGISVDITELKQSQEAIRCLNLQLQTQIHHLNVLNQELESFSYSVSHDLRAPLRTIDGFSQAILEDCAHTLEGDALRYLQRIREGSQQMAQLIDDMLNLSRLARENLNKETINLSALVQQVVVDLQAGEPERQVAIRIQEPLFAEADARLMRAVLENLIGNAWKFTAYSPDACIEFGLTEQHGKPVYFVRDNGAGFDMAYAHQLFGTFQRLHNAAEFAGTGVGLASAQRVIHRHGGEIWAYGEVGKGATFYFTL
ncbi:PAS domain S-box protein [Vampirovibrio sp.]|uniref:PAS domain-containing sensor histidine kinase n=1 Tax=Vampirovibrio sp. TaxID=2717857 RepID=UPI0035945BF5